MRKKILLLIVVVLVSFGVGYYISLPDYKVWNSYSQSNGEKTRDTELTVIVYKYWNYDELIDDIVDEFNEINDDPASTSIEVNLYYSKWHMRNSEPFKTKLFTYEERIKK